MSEYTGPAGQEPSGGDPRAQATADKAQRKAQRPFYKKKRYIIPAVLVAVIAISPKSKQTVTAGGTTSSPTTTVAPISSVPSVDPAASAKAASDQAAATKAAADKAAADKVAADKSAADKAAADKAAADKAAADKAAADKAAADKTAADKAAADKAAAATAAEGTLSQQNAYRSAVDYLKFQAFSRSGLIKQLSSQYGESYPLADAEFAVRRLEREGGVNWNAQAAASAKAYLSNQAFSHQGLVQQLTSQYGDGFTRSEAEYGVKQAGL